MIASTHTTLKGLLALELPQFNRLRCLTCTRYYATKADLATHVYSCHSRLPHAELVMKCAQLLARVASTASPMHLRGQPPQSTTDADACWVYSHTGALGMIASKDMKLSTATLQQ